MFVYYVSRNVQPGDLVNYSDASTMPTGERNQPIVTIPHTAYGDYSGTAIERSNQRVICANKEAAKHVVMLHGSWGGTGLAYIPLNSTHPKEPDSVPAPLVEILANLYQFQMVDAADHCVLECELARDAWNARGRKEFREVLEHVLDEFDPEFNHDTASSGHDTAMHDNALDRLWSTCCNAYGVGTGAGFKIASGAVVEFCFADWRKRVLARPDLLQVFSARYCDGDILSLEKLAELTRV